jgi:diguanylate cyclase (GGDEF)-like protein
VHNKATVNFKAGEEVYALKISTYKPLALKHASEDREQAKSEVRELFKAHIIPMLKASLVAADPLTVLQKEGEFTKALASYEREFVENGKNFSIVLVDIDGLKQINFDHSYAAGDTVLADLAHVLRNNLRVREDSSDKIFRLQKEEFAIIVNEQFEVAAEIAERLRTAVMANPFKLEYPLLGALNNAGEKPVVTCSFGVVDAKDVSKDSNSDIAEKMVLLAKEYLLEAKEPEIDGKGKPVEDSRGNKVCPQPIRLPEHLGNVINI